jgi:hypothetical protein|nr:MAG TPA: AAA domain protein [Caudoviricetes sp.]
MRELLDDIFTNTSLELSSTLVNELIKQYQPAKLISVWIVKPEEYPDSDIIDCMIDEYAIGSYANQIYFILNTETSIMLIYKLISDAELEVVADHIRLLANAPTGYKVALIGDGWPLPPLFTYFPLFKHGIGLLRHAENLPDNVELSLLGPGIDLYPLKDEGTLYGLRIYVSVLKGYRVIELIASDLAKQIPEAETISKATHLVEINPDDPLLRYHKEIDLRKIATIRGWDCAEITNNNLLLVRK